METLLASKPDALRPWHWMLDNNLMDYHSAPVMEDLREVAAVSDKSQKLPDSSVAR
jgi:hypothetical protein